MDEHMEEVLSFWRALMTDESQKAADRLKASENLARFLTREEPDEPSPEDRELRILVDYGGLPCS